jgi:hypothetical protein
MSNFNYSKQRHLELLKLKYSHALTSKQKSELNEYSSVLDGQLDWEAKEQYIDLLEKLVSGKINSFKFYIKFKERNELNDDIFDSLEANFLPLSPHEKSNEFSDFIIEIMDFCYSYSELFESYPTAEKFDSYDLEFRNSVEKFYLKIQKILNEE